MANKRTHKKDVLAVIHQEILEIEPLIREAVGRGDFGAYMEIVTSGLGVERGGDLGRSLESKFWAAVTEARRNKMPRL